MAKQKFAAASRLERALTKLEMATVSDRDLLRRFVSGNDQDAFATLVARHTPMVFGVCRRCLPSVQDAEDACQAVFVLLAKKAGGDHWHSSIANWLYATARKVARNARVSAARRTRRELQSRVPNSVSTVELMSGRELLAVLDEELDKLPSRYCEPLVLCYLEGLTRDEAATRLGVPEATLKSQLERARKKLADALNSRGVELGAALLTTAACATAGQAAQKLLESILTAAAGSPSRRVAAIVRDVSMNGLISNLKLAATLCGIVVLGIAFCAVGPIVAQPENPEPKIKGENTEQPEPKPPSLNASEPLAPRIGTTRFRADLPISDARFSADGKSIVGRAGGVLYVWDAAQGNLLRKIDTKLEFLDDPDQFRQQLFAFAVHPQANIAACGGVKDGKVHLQTWDYENGKLLVEKAANCQALKALTWTPDGKHLLERANTQWREPATWKLIVRSDKLEVIREHELPKAQWAWSSIIYALPDSKHAIIWSANEAPTLYDLESGHLERTFDYRPQLVASGVSISPDGKTLAATGNDEMALFDFAAGNKLRDLPILRGGSGKPRPMFSPDSKTLYVWDHQPIAYDVATGKEKWKAVSPQFVSGGMGSLDLSRDGATLLTRIGNSLAFVDTSTGVARDMAASPCGTAEMVWSPDAKILFTRVNESWRERTWTAWDVATGKRLYYLLPPKEEGDDWKMLPDFFFLADGKELAACLERSGSSERVGPKQFLVFDVATGRFKRKLGEPLPDKEFLWTHPIGVDETGSTVLMQAFAVTAPNVPGAQAQHKYQTIRWNPDKKTKLQEWTVEGSRTDAPRHYAPYCVTIHAEVAGPVASKIRCYSLTDGTLLHELASEYQSVEAFSIQGNFLLSEGFNSVRKQRGLFEFPVPVPPIAYDLWELSSREKIRVLELPKSMPLVLGPDAQYVIRVLDDNSFEIHEPFVLKKAVAKIRTSSSAQHFEFSPDGGKVAVSLADTTIVICDIVAWQKQILAEVAKSLPDDFASLWDDLAKEPAKALRAACLLSAGGEKTIGLLSGHLDAKKAPAEATVSQLLADLDSERFAARDKAEKALRDLAMQAEPSLRKALQANPAAEPRQRIEKLLKEIASRNLTAKECREERAVQALKWMNSDAARRLLSKWAIGDPNATLTRAANAAMRP